MTEIHKFLKMQLRAAQRLANSVNAPPDAKQRIYYAAQELSCYERQKSV